MNAEPHTHVVKLRRQWGILPWEEGGELLVVYGETEVKIPFSYDRVPSARRVARHIRKAIRLHDRGSQGLSKSQRQRAELEALAAAMTPSTPSSSPSAPPIDQPERNSQ